MYVKERNKGKDRDHVFTESVEDIVLLPSSARAFLSLQSFLIMLVMCLIILQ